MSRRLASLALAYAGSVYQHVLNPSDVLDRLHQLSNEAKLNVLGTWRVPGRQCDWREYYDGQLVFRHASAPNHFWTEFYELLPSRGPTVLAHMASLHNQPFTFTECMRATKPTGAKRWIFDLLHKHHIRDGYYIPVGAWIVALWSDRLIQLNPSERASLMFAASHAAFRLDELMRKHLGIDRHAILTARELQVLQELSLGHRPSEIASNLQLSVPTVRTFQARALRKLDAKTPEQAVAKAVRGMLVR